MLLGRGVAMCASLIFRRHLGAVTLACVRTSEPACRRVARGEAVVFRAREAAAGRALPLGVGSFCLPNAVACRIFLLLPPQSKGVCACVCASWRDALDGPELWDTLDVQAERMKSKVFLEVVRRARGQLKRICVWGDVYMYDEEVEPDSYYANLDRIMNRALVEACTLNKQLAQLSVESAILPKLAAAIFASCPDVDFAARVSMERYPSDWFWG